MKLFFLFLLLLLPTVSVAMKTPKQVSRQKATYATQSTARYWQAKLPRKKKRPNQEIKNKLLLKAAQDGKLHWLKSMARPEELNFHDKTNDASPLLVACESGRAKIVEFLSKQLTMEDINERHGRGEIKITPVWLATQKGHTRCVQHLIKAGADVSIPDHQGYLPLHLAANDINLNLINILLLANPETVNTQNIHGVTPLHKVVCNANIGAAALLLAHGANPNIKEANGLSAFDYAAQCAGEKMHELLARYSPERGSVHRDPSFSVLPEDPALTRVAWICMAEYHE